MNRRGFLSALALAPIAAVVAPMLPKQAFASGGMIRGVSAKLAVVGEIGPEITNLPVGTDLIRGIARQGAAEGIRSFAYPDVPYGASDTDFLSLPPMQTETREYVQDVATGTLRDLYLANSAV